MLWSRERQKLRKEQLFQARKIIYGNALSSVLIVFVHVAKTSYEPMTCPHDYDEQKMITTEQVTAYYKIR